MKKKIKIILIVVIILLLCIGFIPIWAFFIEPNLLIIRKIEIKDSALKGIRVAYLTDMHICQDGKDYALNMVKKVNEQNPDIIFLGGDYIVVDIYKNKSMSAEEIFNILSGLKAKYGIFMVMGNHEKHRNSWKKIVKLASDTNIVYLQNSNKKLQIGDKNVFIVGIGDFSDKRHDIKKAFAGVTETPVIAFTHSPDVFPLIPDYVNMTFAGHTHGGQVYIPFYGPLEKPTHLLGNYIKGLYTENNKKMFVSSGIGNSHLKVRLFNIPEIVIADFK